MDEVVRKTGHHLEHEPEWESGVTMQMRLVHVTGLTLCWCGSSVSLNQYSKQNFSLNLSNFLEKHFKIHLRDSFTQTSPSSC